MISQELHLRDYFQVIKRRLWIIITVFVVLVTAVTFWTLRQTPVYRATATLLIDPTSPKIVTFEEVSPIGSGPFWAYKEYSETQQKLIKSPSLAKKVAGELGLKNLPAVDVKSVRNTRLITISVENPDPELAAKMTNTFARVFVDQNVEKNLEVSDKAVEWLSRKMEEQREKLRESEAVVQTFREEHNITILPQVAEAGVSESIKGEYARLLAQYDNYSQRYTDKHPKMVELKAQIRSLKNKIPGLEEVDMGQESMEYRVLERNVQANKRMYEILQTRLKEISLTAALTGNNISIVDEAGVPSSPIRPRVRFNILLAAVAGLIIGTGFGIFAEYMDNTIKTRLDVAEGLEAHLLGSVPDIKERGEVKKDTITMLKPESQISESYRAIRTEILFSLPEEKGMKTILVTSADPQAGKTITLSNLGIVFARNNNRVLLVDTDLRKPRLHKIFDLERKEGLREYLVEEKDINSIVKGTKIKNLNVVTAGQSLSNPAEILGSSRMSSFINEIKDRFDFAFFDSPPVLSVTDATILSNKLDGVIQVVRSGKTHVPVVLDVKEKLKKARAKFIGIILNDLSTRSGYYYYKRYHRYYK